MIACLFFRVRETIIKYGHAERGRIIIWNHLPCAGITLIRFYGYFSALLAISVSRGCSETKLEGKHPEESGRCFRVEAKACRKRPQR